MKASQIRQRLMELPQQDKFRSTDERWAGHNHVMPMIYRIMIRNLEKNLPFDQRSVYQNCSYDYQQDGAAIDAMMETTDITREMLEREAEIGLRSYDEDNIEAVAREMRVSVDELREIRKQTQRTPVIPTRFNYILDKIFAENQ